jgi:hypothetical protein
MAPPDSVDEGREKPSPDGNAGINGTTARKLRWHDKLSPGEKIVAVIHFLILIVAFITLYYTIGQLTVAVKGTQY